MLVTIQGGGSLLDAVASWSRATAVAVMNATLSNLTVAVTGGANMSAASNVALPVAVNVQDCTILLSVLVMASGAQSLIAAVVGPAPMALVDPVIMARTVRFTDSSVVKDGGDPRRRWSSARGACGRRVPSGHVQRGHTVRSTGDTTSIVYIRGRSLLLCRV